MAIINKIYKEVKTGLVKPVGSKRSMKRRGIGGREVTSFRGEIKKLASQRKNERDLTIYTEEMLY